MKVGADTLKAIEKALLDGSATEGKRVNLPAGVCSATCRPGETEVVAAMGDKEFTKAVIDRARLLGWKVAHFRPGWSRDGKRVMTAVQGDGKGFPDLFMVRDRPLAAELKTGSGRVRPEQRAWLEAMRRAGVEAHVWYPRDWAAIVATLGERTPDSSPAGS